MPLTNSQIQDLIAVNIPNNTQQLVTPRKVREVLLAMQEFADFQRSTGDALEGVMSRGNVTTIPPILLSTSTTEVGVQFDLQGDGFAHTGELLPPDGGLTDSRQWRLPDAGGTLATQEWVIENGGGGGGGPIGLNGLTDVTLTSPATGQLLRYNGSAWVNWTPTFAAATHTHAIADVTGLQAALDDKAPMSHAHFMIDIIGLDTALAGKAAVSHTHIIADVTGLQAALDGKQAAGSYAAATHTHIIADVTGLQAALDGKQAAGSYAAATHTHGLGDITGFPSQTGNSGKYLTTDGTNLSWATVSGGGVTTMAAVGSTPNANGASISGTTLTLQPADATNPGILTTGAQSIAGAKTFRDILYINAGATNYGSLRGGGSYFEVESATGRELHLNRSTNAPVIIRGGAASFSSSGNSLGSTSISGLLNLDSTGTIRVDTAGVGGGRFNLATNGQTYLTDLAAAQSPAASVLLGLYSTSRGFLMPVMNVTQLAAISSPAAGLLAIATNDTQSNAIRRYNGSAWAGAESDNWVDYSSTSSVTGWSSTTVKTIRYQLAYRRLTVEFNITGTSNATSAQFTLPFNVGASSPIMQFMCTGLNNGANVIVYGQCSPSSATVTFQLYDAINSVGTFLGSGTKSIRGFFVVEID